MLMVSCTPSSEVRQIATHIVIIGVDGLSPDGIAKAPTPHIDALMQQGAFSMHTRAVMPSSSGANWGSMIMGAGPEQHGIAANNWKTDNLILPPTAVRDDNHFPTVFAVLRDQRPQAHIAAFLHWSPIENFIEKDVLNHLSLPPNERETTDAVVGYFAENKPDLTFIHLDHVDGAGHGFGHGSVRYYLSVARADSLIGEIIQATRDNGMFENTVFLLSSDHGGVGFGHGGISLAEMEIPFIVSGKGTKKNHELRMPTNVYDLPATALFALGIEQPYEWTARPAKNAFQGHSDPVLAYHYNKLEAAPVILPAGEGGSNPPGGFFLNTNPTVSIENPSGVGSIRFTVDGTQPLDSSPTYTGPFAVTSNTVVKTRLFLGGRAVSDERTAYLRIPSDTTGRGLRYRIWETPIIEVLPNFSALGRAATSGHTYEISSNTLVLPRQERIAALLEGYIDIPKDGRYTFSLSSDDGSKMIINNRVIVDNDGDHGVITVSNTILLGAGKHPIRIEWFNGGGGYWLAAYIEGTDLPNQIIPTDMLFRDAN